MKKLMSALLALTALTAMSAVSFAAKPTASDVGKIYIKEDDDDDYYTDEVDTLAPGETGWVFIGIYDKDNEDSKEKPHGISITDGEFTASGETPDDDDEDGKEYKAKKLISLSSRAEKKKIDSTEPKYGWFAKLTVKKISSSKYPEDGYDVSTPIEFKYEWDYDNGDEDVELELKSIEYEDSDDEFEDKLKRFEFDKDDDVDIDLPDDGGTFTGTARKDFDIVASMNTKVNNSLLNKYPNADICFFNGNGANFPVNNGRLTFNANAGDYCYKVDSNGKLVDMSSSWSNSQNAFVIKTTVIGKYIISDTKLSTSVTTTVDSDKPSINEYIGAVAPGTTLTAPTGSRTYTVVAGDSLWGIAQRQLGNGWRYPEIVSLNNLRSNFIYAGQVLVLPNA